jgi:hypothetical protein
MILESLSRSAPKAASAKGDAIVASTNRPEFEESAPSPDARLSTPRLICGIGAETKLRTRKHVELAMAELKADVAGDLAALRRFTIGGVIALLGPLARTRRALRQDTALARERL